MAAAGLESLRSLPDLDVLPGLHLSVQDLFDKASEPA